MFPSSRRRVLRFWFAPAGFFASIIMSSIPSKLMISFLPKQNKTRKLVEKHLHTEISAQLERYKTLTQLTSIDIDEVELNRRIKSFNYPGFPIELNLFGRRFVLKDGEYN